MRYTQARETFEPTSLEEANLAQTKNLMRDAPVRDLQDLVPSLDETVRRTKAAYDKAMAELSEALLQIEERKHG